MFVAGAVLTFDIPPHSSIANIGLKTIFETRAAQQFAPNMEVFINHLMSHFQRFFIQFLYSVRENADDLKNNLDNTVIPIFYSVEISECNETHIQKEKSTENNNLFYFTVATYMEIATKQLLNGNSTSFPDEPTCENCKHQH